MDENLTAQTFWYYFFMLLGFASSAGFVLLVIWYGVNERRERARLRQTKADIADIMILFQTMRDVMTQQKKLARDFNDELDRKMGLVKEVLAKSLDKNERLFERQQQLQLEVDEARGQLIALRSQVEEFTSRAVQPMAHAPAQAQPPKGTPAPPPLAPPRPAPAPAPGPRAAEAPKLVQTSPPKPRQQPELVDESQLADTGITDAPYSVWFGLDFDKPREESPAETHEEEESPHATTPSTPGDPEAARSAFRALLNLPAEAASAAANTAEPPRPESSDNGAQASPPLQQRVVEYFDAGMPIPEIARELGIGKGEVRLMLSLHKPRK